MTVDSALDAIPIRAKGRDANKTEAFLYRRMEKSDPMLAEISIEARKLEQQRSAHLEDITAGQLEVAGDYEQLEKLPDLRRFPVSIARRGGVITREPDRFSFLFDEATQAALPTVLRLTEPQLAAAAQWDMIPTLELPQGITDKGRAARGDKGRAEALMIDDLAFRAVRRIFNVAKRQRVVDLRRHYSGQSIDEVIASLDEAAANQESEVAINWRRVYADYISPATMAERLVETCLTRAGEFTPLPLTTYSAKVGTDLMTGVDLYARYGKDDESALMVGLDVTTSTNYDVVYRKKMQASAADPNQTVRDPRDPSRRVPVTFTIVDVPSVDTRSALVNWQRLRGNSAITPEFFLRYDHRRDLVQRAMQRIRRPDGTHPLGEAEKNMDYYLQAYGAHETKGHIPRNEMLDYRELEKMASK